MSDDLCLVTEELKEQKDTHSVHVARVPLRVWQHAKSNAILSNMPFREYVIRLLEESVPITTENSSQ